MEQFGLKSLRELPDLEQFAPDEESRQFIRERLSATRNAKPVDEMARDIDEDKDLAGDEGDLNQEQEHAQ